jgi:nickel/cobalt transporter (NicO) family protein
MRRLVFALSALLSLWPLSALAHPHIFIDARASVTFNDAGEVVSVHNIWMFDEAYSAWSVQGLDTDHDGKLSEAELQPLADDNMNGLADYEYYTFAGEGKDPNLKFGHGSKPLLVMGADGKTTLDFDVPLAKPYAIRKALELSIDDPEYYVAISFKDAHEVSLVNAPKNCAVTMEDPKEMPPALADALYALPPDVTKLPPELEQAMRGMQGAILINCPGGSATGKTAAPVAAVSPANALDAVNAMADASLDGAAPDRGDMAAPPARQALTLPIFTGNIPFGAAPNEPGLNLPRTGFLGWISAQQQAFYLALEKSMAGLKDNWTGFWVLGLLSFLYGIFHAAGPGHGKVVISSYVLANEAQVRRGILLSFLSAMMQSLVAIGFVLIAASVLGMTAMAMSDAANWIGILSYAMIAVLGLWLIVRKIFGWGHTHDHGEHRHDETRELSSRQMLVRQRMGTPAHVLATGGPQLTSFRTSGPDSYGRLSGDEHYGHSHGDEPHEHGHAHVVTPDQIHGGWREQLSVVAAVGIRPCSGALIVLAFALSQGLLLAGIVAVLLMGLGTAITTGALASIAVGFKGLARGLAGSDNKFTGALVWWAELLAAFGVFAFGVILVLASI